MEAAKKSEIVVEIETQLATVEPTDAATLKEAFAPYFTEANKWIKEATGLIVTSVEQKDVMKQARENRLALKAIRNNVERTRKGLKVGLNRKGKAIDGLANIAKYLIEPVEERLQEQEDYVKRIEEERRDSMEADRIEALTKAGVENLTFYDLRRMPQEQFVELLLGAKQTQRLKNEEAVKIEQEKVRKEKEEQEQREKVAKENERLREEAEAQKEVEANKQMVRDIEEKARKKQEAKEKEKQDKILAEEKKKADAEKAKREALEKEIADKKAREEQERKEKEEVEEKEKRDAELAPDREKLMRLAVAVASIPMPKVKSVQARKIIENITEGISAIVGQIKEGVNKL